MDYPKNPKRPKSPLQNDSYGGYAAIYGGDQDGDEEMSDRLSPGQIEAAKQVAAKHRPTPPNPVPSNTPTPPDSPEPPHQPEKPVQPEKPRNKRDEWQEILAAGGQISDDDWEELIRTVGARGAY